MAEVTLDRLAAGIRAANAKGDIETVKKLGAAYRQLQAAPQPNLPSGAQLTGKVSDLPSQRPTFADEAMSFGRGIIEGVPVIGPGLADARRGLDANLKALFQGGDAGTYQDEFKAADQELAAMTGGARTAGNVTGAVASLAPLGATGLGGRLLGTAGTLPERLIMSAGSGGAISGADTLARGGSLEDAAKSALVGGALGGVFPAVGGIKNAISNRAAQKAATNAAIKNAPGSADLKATASALFENSRAASAGVKADEFKNLAANLVQKAMASDIDKQLDGEAVAVYERMVGMVNEAAQSGGVSLSRLHNLRQLAQDVAIDATKDRTKRFAGQIVDGLDDLIGNLKTSQMTGQGGTQAANDLMEGISTWSRAKKLGVIEEAMRKADFQKSGLENGLRLQFLAILRDPKKAKLFSKAELAEIEKVAKGTLGNNVLNLLGKFGFGIGNGSPNALGGAIGLTLGGLPGMAAASAARKGSEILTEKAAERAAKVVATPNIPQIARKALPQGLLPGALLPLEVTRQREPLRITVRGGGSTS